MNILITFLSAKRDVFGGMERSIYSLIQGLEYNGCNVYVYTAVSKEKEANFIYSKYLKNTFLEDISMIDFSILENYKIYSEVLKEEVLNIIDVKRIDYILVEDQLWGILPHIDIMDCIKCKVGIVYHMYLQKDLIIKTLQLPFTHYFAVSNDVRNKINKINNFKKNIDLLPNSYNEEDFFENIGVKKEKRIFCNTRLAENKGIEYLLNAFVMFHKEYVDYDLLLCGGEFHFGNRSKIFYFINSFLDKHPELAGSIKILGNLEWKQIPEFIQKSEMVVLPSGYESFGIAALETIACGTSLIVTNVGNLPDLVEGAGILIPYADSESLYYAMRNVVKNKELSNTLRDNCRKVKGQYEAKRVAKELILKIGDNKSNEQR